MAGFRTFATGEVLTAANVNNFLMKQSVMVFADADARTAALGAEVIEGMLTYNKDTDQLEVFDGTNFVIAAPEPPAPPAGIGSNVVQTVKTNTFTASVTSGNISGDVTGLTATFTPSSASSKILVILTINLSVSGDGGGIIVYRDGDPSVFIGDSEGSRTRGSGGIFSGGSSLPASIGTVAFLEDAGSTTPTVFSVRLHNHSPSTIGVAVNRSGSGDANSARSMRSASAFTVIEVAA